jgi:hypothetical protein
MGFALTILGVVVENSRMGGIEALETNGELSIC